MQIDAHQHFWNFDPVRDSWITDEMRAIRTNFTPYDLLKELRENGMDGSVAVQADASENETAFLVDIADRHDFVKGVVGWVDLKSSLLDSRLDFYHRTAACIKGFRHIVQAEPDDMFLMGEQFCRGISRLGEYGYTYDILIYPRQLPAAVALTAKFPGQKFVIDHLAKPDIRDGRMEPWAAHIREIATHPNVWCKVSGMVTEADWRAWKAEDLKPYLDVVFEAFGPERLMFGSDWPVCLVAGGYARWKQALTAYLKGFSQEERRGVMGDNATSFYNL
jgi:L-fuconolactonase